VSLIEHVMQRPLSRRLRGVVSPSLETPPSAEVALPAGGLELLVLQPSPFCNLDCDYCYLPDRDNRQRMPPDVLDRVMRQVAASGLVGAELGIAWHAGEPTAVPRNWYETAFDTVKRHLGATRVTHHFQTNAVLIDPAWCDFFARHQVRIGVSLDGPAALHDRHRRTRHGQGTHARVMSGIAQLKAAGLPFHVIAVLTRDALGRPDALVDFFAALGADQLGFNVEEIEAANPQSSLAPTGAADDPAAALRSFWRRVLERLDTDARDLRVREIASVTGALRDPRYGQHAGSMQNQIGRMLTVAHDGSYTFWSPELLGAVHPRRGAVVLGNLARDAAPWRHLAEAARWQHEIDAGVRQCRERCRYFDLCLGGAPANKLSEHGSMAVTETLACRLGQQVMIDAVLEGLAQRLNIRPLRSAGPRR
jgi:uncharacterized protein